MQAILDGRSVQAAGQSGARIPSFDERWKLPRFFSSSQEGLHWVGDINFGYLTIYWCNKGRGTRVWAVLLPFHANLANYLYELVHGHEI